MGSCTVGQWSHNVYIVFVYIETLCAMAHNAGMSDIRIYTYMWHDKSIFKPVGIVTSSSCQLKDNRW